jgi:phosphate transport system substrate-binding protein
MKETVMKTSLRRLLTGCAAVGIVGLVIASPGSLASANGTHQQITGSGSSWASNAVDQWVADVLKSGLQVVFTGTGSATGRRDFADQTSDFAVSDIGYQGTDPESGASDTPCSDPSRPSTCLDYAYVPIVAGGTSFPYQIRVGGHLITNLRLSGETLTKIFTNSLGTKGTSTYMNWDNPEITADNNGRKLPSLGIIPVVHSEGSGSSAQFTRYMATEYPKIWTPYNSNKDVEAEYYPQKAPQVAQNGSDGVINFVTSTAGNGAIGYDEYSYALNKSYPVAQLENKAGYFTSPTQYNVAVALTKAKIDYHHGPDYLLQNLNNVYANPDKRTYPMSSYSYGIIPTGPNSNDGRMNTAKRQTIADFLYYSVCQGQGEIGPIGYSALPINLVEASFKQIGLLHAVDKGVNLNHENVTTCHNPTFVAGHPDDNHLAQIAPEPLPCQKVGAGPCGTAPAPNGPPKPGGTVANPTPSSSGPNDPNSPGTSSSSGPDASSTNQPGSGVPGVDPGASAPPGTTAVDTGGGGTELVGTPINVAASSNSSDGILAGIAVVELLLIIAMPAFVATWLRRRKQSR